MKQNEEEVTAAAEELLAEIDAERDVEAKQLLT